MNDMEKVPAGGTRLTWVWRRGGWKGSALSLCLPLLSLQPQRSEASGWGQVRPVAGPGVELQTPGFQESRAK